MVFSVKYKGNVVFTSKNLKDALKFAYKRTMDTGGYWWIYMGDNLYGITQQGDNQNCSYTKVIYRDGVNTERYSHYLLHADGSTLLLYSDKPKKSKTNDAGLPGLRY